VKRKERRLKQLPEEKEEDERVSSLKVQIEEQMKAALKAHDQLRLDTLRLLLSEIKNKEIEKRGNLEEGEIVALIRKEIKKRQESEEYFEKGNRSELLEKAEKEIAILQDFSLLNFQRRKWSEL